MKEKIKIMRTLPTVTDEDIKSLMDFDALLSKKNKLIQQRRNVRNIKILGAVIALIVIPTSLLLLPVGDTGPAPSPAQQNLPPASSAAKENIDTIRSQGPQDSSTKKDPIQPSNLTRHTGPAAPVISKQERVESKEPNAVAPIIPVYHQAEPAEGYPVLYEYFSRNLVYPEAALSDSVEGVVDVVFVIDVAGKPANIAIENSLGPLFDKEALRLVQHMPLWKPATYNGKPVQSKLSLPITFGLQKISTP